MSNPGAEFLQRRLARAQCIPADQRSPEVAAFVESEAALAEARSLLPLDGSGAAALPLVAATKQRLNLAMLLTARAHYLSPREPATQEDTFKHLGAYLQPPGRPYAPLHNFQTREDLLASVLLVEANMPGTLCRDMPFWTVLETAASRVMEPANQGALRRQLQRLAASPHRLAAQQQPAPLTLDQLRYLC